MFRVVFFNSSSLLFTLHLHLFGGWCFNTQYTPLFTAMAATTQHNWRWQYSRWEKTELIASTEKCSVCCSMKRVRERAAGVWCRRDAAADWRHTTSAGEHHVGRHAEHSQRQRRLSAARTTRRDAGMPTYKLDFTTRAVFVYCLIEVGRKT